MNINGISGITTEMPKVGLKTDGNSESPFKAFYEAAIGTVNETNTLQKEADQMSMDFALGKVDSIHEVMIAQEKASIALQYTVQLRDSIMDAYKEIMRMQV